MLSNTQRVTRNQGRRLVTAQLDGNIKFYCRSGDIYYHHTPLLNMIRIITTNPLLILAATANAGTWAEEDDKKSVAPRSAHAAPVNRVSWAHPEFGQIVASCSNDKTVRCVVLRRNNRGGGLYFPISNSDIRSKYGRSAKARRLLCGPWLQPSRTSEAKYDNALSTHTASV